MTRRLALVALAVASPAMLLASVAGGRAAELAFAVLAVAFPAFLMALGATDRDGRLGPIAWPIGALLAVLTAGLAVLLALAGEAERGTRLFGLPLAAAIQLIGLFLVPLVLTAFGFALTFDRFGVAEEDLARLRRGSRAAGDE